MADKRYHDEAWLRHHYQNKKLSAYDIADKCGVSHNSIQHFLDKFGIETRSQAESTRTRFGERKYYDEDWLRNQYEEMGKSSVKIADECGVTANAIINWIHKHGIEMRSLSEAQFNREQSGEDNPAWNGGRPRYYGPNWKEQRQKALERDDGRCQDCGMTRERHREEYGKDIHVHHVQPVATYESPSEANALNNLVTLCYPHHRRWEGVPVKPTLLD